MPIPKKTTTAKTSTKKTTQVKSKKIAQKKAIAKIPKAKQADDKTIKKIVSQVTESPKIKKDIKKKEEKIVPIKIEQDDSDQIEGVITSKEEKEQNILETTEPEQELELEHELERGLEHEKESELESEHEPRHESESELEQESKHESEHEPRHESERESEHKLEPEDQELDRTNLDEVYNFDHSDDGVDNYSNNKKKVPITMYRKIAFSFIILTLALLVVIFYFTFVKVTIKIKTSEEVFNQNLIVDIYDSGKIEGESKNKEIIGVVKKFNIELSKKYESTGSEIVDKEIYGKVSVINKYSKDQPLVTNTRLLSPDGKLFRISKGIKVTSQGTTEVEIYADKPGPEMAIKPTIFTIPGLWSGLQDKIYAESKESFKYQEVVDNFIVKSDIENALVDANKEIITKAKTEVAKMYENYDNFIYKINEDSVEQDVGGKINDKVDEFPIDIKTDVIVVAFNNKQIKDLAYQKLITDVPYDKKLIKLNSESFNYNLNNYDLTEGVASLNVVFSGELSFDEDIGTLIEKEKLLDLTREQLEGYLKGRNDISSFEIKFWPSFISKVPNLVDRIEIIIMDN